MQQKVAKRHYLLYRNFPLIYALQGEAWVSQSALYSSRHCTAVGIVQQSALYSRLHCTAVGIVQPVKFYNPVCNVSQNKC